MEALLSLEDELAEERPDEDGELWVEEDELWVPGRAIPPRRVLEMPDELVELLNEDPVAYALFAKEERERVEDSFTYFITNYGSHVPAKGGSRLPLDKLFAAQEKVLIPALERLTQDLSQLIVLKTRRFGFTLLVIHFFYWLTHFAREGHNTRVLCISNSARAAELLLRQYRSINAYLNETVPWLYSPMGAQSRNRHGQPGIDKAAEIEIAHRGASIVSLPPNEAARSETASVVFLDELGRYYGSANPADMYQAAEPTAEGGGKVIIGSTSGGRYGKGKLFADLWIKARSGEIPGMHPIFLPRSARPGRDKAWEREKIAKHGIDRFRMEYPETEDEALMGNTEGLFFSLSDIDEWVRRGRELDRQLAAGELPPPQGGIKVGIDWGGHSAAVLLYKLPGHGLYICDELTGDRVSAGRFSLDVAELAGRYGRLTRARYDSAGAQQMESFRENVRGVEITPVPFGKWKRRSAEHMKHMGERTAAGETIGYLAVSPRCKTLISQAREYVEKEDGTFQKGNDHTVDAALAVLAPEYAEWSRDVARHRR